MRIWSLHPSYLDSKGLVALWRETLLAKHVLEGKTKGYKNHPQLNRFKKTKDPVAFIHRYLAVVHEESVKRGFQFDASKFKKIKSTASIPVTSGQMAYEWKHLQRKLKTRDPFQLKKNKSVLNYIPHPIFRPIDGEVESWEIITAP